MSYTKKTGAVFPSKPPVVSCPKRRCPVLVAPVDTRLKALFEGIAEDRELARTVSSVF